MCKLGAQAAYVLSQALVETYATSALAIAIGSDINVAKQ